MSKLDICVCDTIETFMFEKESFEIKIKHNISELTSKNAYLTTILKEICSREKETIE